MAVRRTLALALLVGALAVGIGCLAAYASFPSSEELQRRSLEELGFSEALLDSPLVRAILDEFGGGVEDMVVTEVRQSLLLGAGVGGVVVAVGFGLVLAADRRRAAEPAAGPPQPPPQPPPPAAS